MSRADDVKPASVAATTSADTNPSEEGDPRLTTLPSASVAEHQPSDPTHPATDAPSDLPAVLSPSTGHTESAGAAHSAQDGAEREAMEGSVEGLSKDLHALNATEASVVTKQAGQPTEDHDASKGDTATLPERSNAVPDPPSASSPSATRPEASEQPTDDASATQEVATAVTTTEKEPLSHPGETKDEPVDPTSFTGTHAATDSSATQTPPTDAGSSSVAPTAAPTAAETAAEDDAPTAAQTPAPPAAQTASPDAAPTAAATTAAEKRPPPEALDLEAASSRAGQLSPSTNQSGATSSPMTPSHSRLGKGPPPSTPAAEEKSFDFNRFLEQLRDKRAQPVGEYVRSFIRGFAKKPYRVADQSKLIFDFLGFIAGIMEQTQPFSALSPTEFDNALEAMEKLIMNRLYAYTFAPAMEKGKWKVNTDDLERDQVLSERVEMMRWVREEHLDVPRGESGAGFLEFAQQELLKINHYKAPRDKVICILNCCKVIFGFIRHVSGQESADSFIPILIFVVLRANPEHLISNVEYISRFRSPDRLSAEVQYYISSLMGAIAFIETMDHTSLSNITQEDFERNVEREIVRLADERAEREKLAAASTPPSRPSSAASHSRSVSGGDVMGPSQAGEESAKTLPIAPLAASLADDTRAFFQRTGEAARQGLGASLSKPMGALGKLFNEGLIDGMRSPHGGSNAGSTGHSGLASPARGVSPVPGVGSGSGSGSGHQHTSSGSKGLFTGLFGGEMDGNAVSATPPTKGGASGISGAGAVGSGGAASPAPLYNPASWSRSFRGGADEDLMEPSTPVTENPRNQLFPPANVTERASARGRGAPSSLTSVPDAPRAQRVAPVRRESVDPYSDQFQDDLPSSGVGTPSDEGSDAEDDSRDSPAARARKGEPGRSGGEAGTSGGARGQGRSRLSDLASYMPSFLTEQPTPSRPPTEPHRAATAAAAAAGGADASGDISADVAEESAEIERVHLAAGVETLRSVFPGVEKGVVEMVLEGCNGDVQAAIDRLLEMS